MECFYRRKRVISRWWFIVFSFIFILTPVGCVEVASEEGDRNTISLNLPVKKK